MKNNRSPLDVCINFNNIHLKQTIKTEQMLLSTPTYIQPKSTKVLTSNEKCQRKTNFSNQRKQNYQRTETKNLFSKAKSCPKNNGQLKRVHSSSSFQKRQESIEEQLFGQNQLKLNKNRSVSKFQEQTLKTSIKDLQITDRINSIFENVKSILSQKVCKSNQEMQYFNYQQMLQYLYKCGYIKHEIEKYYQTQEQKQELKTVYTLWISLSNHNSKCLIINLIILSYLYENLMKQLDYGSISQKLSQTISITIFDRNTIQTTQKKRNNFSENSFTKYSPQQSYHMQPVNIVKTKQQPINLFFVKKKILEFDENGIIKLTEKDKVYLQKIYKKFIENLTKYHKIVVAHTDQQNQNNKMEILTKKRCCSVQQNNSDKKNVDRLSQKVKTNKTQEKSIAQSTKKVSFSNENKTVSIFIETCKANKEKKSKNSNVRDVINELSKPKSIPKQKSSDQIQFQKDSKQFTFHPKTNSQIKPNKESIIKKIKNVDQVIYRMQQARDLKQKKEELMKSGWTNQEKISKANPNGKTKIILTKNCNQNTNQKQQKQQVNKVCFQKILNQTKQQNHQKNNKEQQQQEQIQIQKQPEGQIKSAVQSIINSLQTKNNFIKSQSNDKIAVNSCATTPSPQEFRIPILYIDVNIQDGKKERIIIYEGDKAEQLSHQFGKRHKLDKDTIQRLQAMLQQQIRSVLTRIDQETQQDSSIVY